MNIWETSTEPDAGRSYDGSVSFESHLAVGLDRAVDRLASAAPSAPPRDWMRALSEHFTEARARYPDDELCLVFDIDGTILDLRHLTVHVLLAYDRARGTRLFHGLVADDVVHHEDEIEAILASLDVADDRRPDVAAFYRAHLWDPDAILAASRPFEGVFGVIRWFQLQPRTHVALNTGRPDGMRDLTLRSLNTIGRAYRVAFPPELLLTAAGGDVPQAKLAGLERLREAGYRVVAVIDNEPENLAAMARIDRAEEVLFLHADTIFRSQRPHRARVVSGRDYRLRELVPPRTLPDRVQFVWHGVNDVVNLDRFLDSEVAWAEIDVRSDPFGRLVLRHDGFEEVPWSREEPLLTAEEALDRLVAAGRCVKLDLKEGGPTLAAAVELVRGLGLCDERLWFNAELPAIGEEGFRSLRAGFPSSTLSCPVDFLVPLVLAAAADQVLDLLRSWGIDRLSVRWGPRAREVLDLLEQMGWRTNLYGVPDLESFLEASLLLPASVTADFNFPEWRYFGRGSGQRVAASVG
jgi:hypothetical protein